MFNDSAQNSIKVIAGFVETALIKFKLGNNIVDSSKSQSVESNYDAWEHICQDIFPDDRKRGLIVLVTVYCDAAYNKPAKGAPELPMHAISGYVATQDNWRRFRNEWRAELAKVGLSHFHMNEFEYARKSLENKRPIPERNPFYGWSLDKFEPFYKRLARTICRKTAGEHRLGSYGSAVVKNNFDALRPNVLADDVRC